MKMRGEKKETLMDGWMMRKESRMRSSRIKVKAKKKRRKIYMATLQKPLPPQTPSQSRESAEDDVGPGGDQDRFDIS
jgi:hypothetical protein